MPKVAISADFLLAFSNVPAAQQKKVREFTEKFRANPMSASINYEPIHFMKDSKVRTVRIGKDYRAIVIHPPKGDVYLLVWVDHHDEAMAWAKNKVFDVNPATGALQVVDVEEATSLAEESAKRAEEHKPEKTPRLFDGFEDDGLMLFGLPRVLLPSVRELYHEDELDRLRPHLPAEAFEGLLHLALGATLEEAVEEVTKPRPAAGGEDADFEQALNHPDTQRRFKVVKDSRDLVDMLNAPLEQWRVFLHPDQAALVQREFNGPARVLGGAGTGKTVVAMHRARHLAREVFNASTDRILFTTFSRNLAINLSGMLKDLCGEELARIEVVNVDAWAARFMRNQGITFDVARRPEVDDIWGDVFAEVDPGKFEQSFYRDEWTQVVQWNGIDSFEGYVQTPRVGRKVRISRSDKKQVWEVLNTYRQLLRDRGKVEWGDVTRETRQYLEDNPGILPYKAVIVDEAQDMDPEKWRLIAAIAPKGEGVKNNIFLVGDAHQRIYGRKVVLSRLGLEIRGRSRRLKINYRTTEAIRRWATAVVNKLEYDDLDGGLDTTQGYKSIRDGQKPDHRHFSDLASEQSFLVEQIQALSKQLAAKELLPDGICLVARNRRQLKDDYIPALESAGLSYTFLDGNTDSDAGDGIRVATMHRVKGLEFSNMILAGVNKSIVPRVYDSLSEAEAEQRERSILYVASSRARDHLTVTSYGEASPLIATR